MQGSFKIVVILFLVNKIWCFIDLKNLIQVDPDTFKNVSELISSNDYPLEEYIVQTIDGYLLSVQRIPYGKKMPDRTVKRRVVLLIHGGVGDTNVYVWNGPEQSLGFILADNGYDVWMGNLRGNTYSRRNVRLSPEEVEFWDFSLQEKSVTDLPAIIDFILKETGQNSLSYVGYSESTTVAFILLSEIPLYNKKINFLGAYGPLAFSTHMTGILGLIVHLIIFTQPFYKQIGFVEFFPHTVLLELFSVFVCSTPLRFICEGIYYGIFGYDPTQLNVTKLPLYANQYFAGESVKIFIHYSQIGWARRFQKFDYLDRNQEYYNQDTPPEYDLSKITVPVALYSGAQDVIAHPLDVESLRGKLQSVVEYNTFPDHPMINHGDLILGIDAYSQIHKKLLSALEKYATI